jgi:muconolactone delta-isomerase
MMNDDEDFGQRKQKSGFQNKVWRIVYTASEYSTEKISDSQRLENSHQQIINQVPVNQQSKIKRIVLFYENGKFESFEP